MKLRYPDYLTVYTEKDAKTFPFAQTVSFDDVSVSMTEADGAIRLQLTADTTPVRYIRLRYNFTDEEKRKESVRILGDTYERGYGTLRWEGIVPERMMTWYMLVSNGSDRNPDCSGRFTEGFGVKVQPNSFVNWQYDSKGVSMWADVRCGGLGVLLGGRTLDVCDIVFGEYRDCSAFEAGRAFCRMMCPTSVLPDHKVYGSNNWYYAYGKSSHDEILGDTKIVADQCEGLDNIPYMVIDDGWQKNGCDAPWNILRDTFHDMKELAGQMRAASVRPGIWVRYLIDNHHEIEGTKPEWYMPNNPNVLDPSVPEVLAYIRETTKMLRGWGYELIKHDFSCYDCFGKWGSAMRQSVTDNGWSFRDNSKTSAEIYLAFCRAVREAAGDDCVIIGCNTVSHLVAGMYELNRTGDDTSGFEWNRTRFMGVNTLAMRMIQNGIFYMTDADCVGITGAIPWELNRQWLDLLAKSGSPLFVSCKPGVLKDNEYKELKEAWAINSVQQNDCRPLDWMDNECPEIWLIDGKEVRYDWYEDTGVASFRP